MYAVKSGTYSEGQRLPRLKCGQFFGAASIIFTSKNEITMRYTTTLVYVCYLHQNAIADHHPVRILLGKLANLGIAFVIQDPND